MQNPAELTPFDGTACGGRVSLPLGLTPREREVLHWISEGKRDREIACIIGVSERTAEHHVGSLLRKLAVETRTGAARIALTAISPLRPGPTLPRKVGTADRVRKPRKTAVRLLDGKGSKELSRRTKKA